jgi:hypothetical protein
MPLTSKPLAVRTWPAFARLVEKHNGIFGGCWCISFHLKPGEKRHGAAAYRAMKKTLVREGRAHAALIFDGRNVAEQKAALEQAIVQDDAQIKSITEDLKSTKDLLASA